MKKQFVQYSGIVFATFFAFGNFIACGAKMYKVSLEDDTTPPRNATNLTNGEGGSYSEPFPGIHAPLGWATLPIPYKFSKSLEEDQKVGLLKAMKTWERAVGKQLFEFHGEDPQKGDHFKDLYSSLDDSTNGHYQDNNWDKTGKSDLVLATTIWETVSGEPYQVSTADIRFNAQYYVIGDSYTAVSDGTREVVDMESLALHELGHLLGLSHISEEDDPLSIMNPSLYIGEGLTSRKISKGDIDRIQRIYGCEGGACDVEETFALLEKGDFEDAEEAVLEAH